MEAIAPVLLLCTGTLILWVNKLSKRIAALEKAIGSGPVQRQSGLPFSQSPLSSSLGDGLTEQARMDRALAQAEVHWPMP